MANIKTFKPPKPKTQEVQELMDKLDHGTL